MELNHECVRDLLLAIESLPKWTSAYPLPHILENTDLKSKSYSIEEIAYTAVCLEEAGFIKAEAEFKDFNYFHIQRLTWNGHEFLDNIRDPEIWKQTKSSISKIAGMSLVMAGDVAKNILFKYLELS